MTDSYCLDIPDSLSSIKTALANILSVQKCKSIVAVPDALFSRKIVTLHFQSTYNKASECGSLVQIFRGMLVFLVCHSRLTYANHLKKKKKKSCKHFTYSSSSSVSRLIGRTMISTRRFFSRFAAISFLATGLNSP